MKNFLAKPYRWAVIFSILLLAAVTFTLLDTFVLEKSVSKVSTSLSSADQKTIQIKQSYDKSKAVITDNSYRDENIKITIETVRKYDTNMYVADIQISDASYLKTAFANDTYGRNIKSETSNMAKEKMLFLL